MGWNKVINGYDQSLKWPAEDYRLNVVKGTAGDVASCR